MAKVVKELIQIAIGLIIELSVFLAVNLAAPIAIGLYSGAYTLKLTGNGYIAIPVAIGVGVLAMLNSLVWWMEDWTIYKSPLFNMDKE